MLISFTVLGSAFWKSSHFWKWNEAFLGVAIRCASTVPPGWIATGEGVTASE